jgi:hypothetical protein
MRRLATLLAAFLLVLPAVLASAAAVAAPDRTMPCCRGQKRMLCCENDGSLAFRTCGERLPLAAPAVVAPLLLAATVGLPAPAETVWAAVLAVRAPSADRPDLPDPPPRG